MLVLLNLIRLIFYLCYKSIICRGERARSVDTPGNMNTDEPLLETCVSLH